MADEEKDRGGVTYVESIEPKKNNRTCLEKILAIICVCLLIIIIILAASWAGSHSTSKPDTAAKLAEMIPDSEDAICYSPTCIQTAARVLQNVDTTVDPCDNFYDFACGGWMKSHVIPSERGNLYAYGVLREDVKLIMKALLEEEIKDNEIESIKNVKHLYNSCIDEETIETRNASVMITLLEELGGWPLLGESPGGKWDQRSFDFETLLLKLSKYYNTPIVPCWVGLDDRNNTRRIIFVDQTWFGMPDRSYYLDDILVDRKAAYKTMMFNVAILLGADKDTLYEEIEGILELETQLANITATEVERKIDRELLYKQTTIRELQNNVTNIDKKDPIQFNWLSFLQKTLYIPDDKVNITEDEEIILVAESYYKQLFPTLRKFSKRTIANYMVWRIAKNRLINLPERFRHELQIYKTALYGTKTSVERWKTCVGYIKSTWELVIGRMFIQHSFNNESKVEALDMISNIREAFNNLVNDSDWMDDDMKAAAREKAEHIAEIVGYPEFLFNDTTLDSLHEHLPMHPDKYFENVLTILKSDSKDSLDKLRKPNIGSRKQWTTSPTTVNAFYSFQRNQITFPAGILQPPYFHVDQPRSMNYGGIGFMMGHEITHGFDNTGRLYDKDGNLNNWWTAEGEEMYKQRAQCLVDQYGKFVSPEAKINVNGINTQGENIADNGGLKQSYAAYKKWVSEPGGTEPLLPGVPYNHDQLFFLGFAHVRCGLNRPKDAHNHILTGVHSPGRFRVTGCLQNMPEFSQAFQCPLNSTMNPEHKCAVW